MFNRRMNSGEKLYIWQSADWPNWRYDLSVLMEPLTQVSRARRPLPLGRLADVGMALRDQASLAALTDVVKTKGDRRRSAERGVRAAVHRSASGRGHIGAVALVDRHAVVARVMSWQAE